MSNFIHFLNTGSSDCIIIESNGHFAMVDAGEDSDYPANKPHLNYPGYRKAEPLFMPFGIISKLFVIEVVISISSNSLFSLS